jgi:hypothetical protein
MDGPSYLLAITICMYLILLHWLYLGLEKYRRSQFFSSSARSGASSMQI